MCFLKSMPLPKQNQEKPGWGKINDQTVKHTAPDNLEIESVTKCEKQVRAQDCLLYPSGVQRESLKSAS